MILERITVGPFAVNCYILGLVEQGKAIIIDPGADYQKIKKILDRNRLTPGFIINTHGHADHIAADDQFGVNIYIHNQDAVLLKDPQGNLSQFLMGPIEIKSPINLVEDSQDVYLEKIHLKVIHTPGHTPGSICLLLIAPENKILFSGDTLFADGVGRTDFPRASEDLLRQSIKDKLFILREDTVVYPGHGPTTTIGKEKKSNPFLL
jgi:glyoxylase-like metal-dependent hydrolase (beta-lactamase superfamily II)